MDKKTLRKQVSSLRDQLSLETREEYSVQIHHHLQELTGYHQATTIACFVSFRSEVDTIPVIKDRLQAGKRIVLPITDLDERELIFSELRDFDQELALSTYGILEPKAEFVRPIAEEEIDLVLMPGLVFDPQGYRIGYGGGYYDRFLNKLVEKPLLVALAFDLQVQDEPVPYEDYDIPVDFIVTEQRIIDCRANRKG